MVIDLRGSILFKRGSSILFKRGNFWDMIKIMHFGVRNSNLTKIDLRGL